MAGIILRIGIVGASSLMGKELAEELGNSDLAAASIVLLDEEETTGQIASVGDEAAFIQRIEEGSFTELDLLFFAGKPEETLRHWPAVKKAGVPVVDLTYALAHEPGSQVRSPWVARALGTDAPLGFDITVVVPAHPVAVMLGLVAARTRNLGVSSLLATVLLPASERGQAGMDELQKQTVSLLSFQSLPTEVFDAQVAFNLLPTLGEAAKVSLEDIASQIQRDYEAAGPLPPLTLQVIQAPVFHGYTISLFLQCTQEITPTNLAGDHAEVLPLAANLTAAGSSKIQIQPHKNNNQHLTADNTRIAAKQAIDCGISLLQVRPKGQPQ